MDIIFIICSLLFIFALIFHYTSYSEENNATGYDDSILVIVFDESIIITLQRLVKNLDKLNQLNEQIYELKESIINVLQQLMKNLNEQIYELKENIINTFQRLMKNLNKEKQENEQIRILEQENKRLIQEIQRIKNEMNNNINAHQKQIYILEQENKRLIQEIQRIKNEMNNNINAHQKQIYQMEYARLQFKEVLQNERTRLRTNYQNRFNEYFQYYDDYFQNLTLQSTEEIR
ncbi:28149_t:CDS:1 [Dentiscutata erythropus]|uniref:28149_t:CDS:1 n=1 Tax=Dentiscutata erythropus TaxID=1348616 RepID=A0A9N9N376_9GLOM|nr:28149_t:CDS:1 [Dentiscutata erythropus]